MCRFILKAPEATSKAFTEINADSENRNEMNEQEQAPMKCVAGRCFRLAFVCVKIFEDLQELVRIVGSYEAIEMK